MPEKPYEALLHRELHVHDVEQHFSAQLAMVRDMVNYGTNLIPACLVSSERRLGDVIAITVLFKHVVMMFDAYEVLMSKACNDAAQIQSRAICEASLYLDWMLQSDIEKKALYYYVSNVRKEKQWVSRGILNGSEQQTFFANLGSFAQAMEPTRLKLATESPKRLQEIDAFLAKPPFVAVNQALASKRGQRPYEPAWHEPLGQKSVRGIARALGRLHEYEVFYAASSEVMHASKYTDHIKIGMGKVKLEPIRHLEEFAGNLRYTVATAISTYRKLLTYYRPGQLVEFSNRYVQEWRDAFMNMPNIKYAESSDAAMI